MIQVRKLVPVTVDVSIDDFYNALTYAEKEQVLYRLDHDGLIEEPDLESEEQEIFQDFVEEYIDYLDFRLNLNDQEYSAREVLELIQTEMNKWE